MRRVLFAPFAKLRKLETRFELLVLRRVIIHPLAHGALKLDECFLRHNDIKHES